MRNPGPLTMTSGEAGRPIRPVAPPLQSTPADPPAGRRNGRGRH